MNHNQKYLLSGKCLQTLYHKISMRKGELHCTTHQTTLESKKKLEQCLGGTYSQITAKCSHWKLLNDTGEPCLAWLEKLLSFWLSFWSFLTQKKFHNQRKTHCKNRCWLVIVWPTSWSFLQNWLFTISFLAI